MRLALASLGGLVAALATPAAAQSVERTYPGDPFEAPYRAAASAIFEYFPDYECTLESSTSSDGLRTKFLASKKLDPSTPTITGICRFTTRKCFSRGDVVMMCFEHGGVMIVDRMKFSRKMTKAVVELTFFLGDAAGKAAGLGFSKASLEQAESGWRVLKFEDTGALEEAGRRRG